jgi:hypothetical protein
MKTAKFLLLAGSFAVVFAMATYAGAEGVPLLTPEKGMVGMGTMTGLDIITLSDSVRAGKKMFNDTKLGHNTTGQSCATCHSGGGSVGGTAEMKWKGMAMQVAIPTLKGAAAHFPAVRGPMKVVTDLMGMNNMCLMTFLKGKPLNKNSHQAIDLESYVASLSKGKRYDPGGAPTLP